MFIEPEFKMTFGLVIRVGIAPPPLAQPPLQPPPPDTHTQRNTNICMQVLNVTFLVTNP